MEQSAEKNLIYEILQDPRLGLEPGKVPENAVDQLLTYTRLWQKWNAKISLTAEKDPGLFIKNHLFISLLFIKRVEGSRGLVDIGSGAGLPGIPIKIILPNIPMLLVECRRKRASFLMTVIRELGLNNIEVADSKVESLVTLPFIADTTVFRAVADTATCLNWSRGILPQGGKVVLLRTQEEAENPKLPEGTYLNSEKFPLQDYSGNPLFLVEYNI